MRYSKHLKTWSPSSLSTILRACAFILILPCGPGIAQGTSASGDSSETWSYHFQYTGIEQTHGRFSASYSGQNSLSDDPETHFSVTTTMFVGRKLWTGGEFYLDPEMSGGSGFSLTRGVAGFPNGEVYRVDDVTPKIFIARGFLRQNFLLGEPEKEKIEPDQNQLAEWLPTARLTLTVGKFSLTDIFDDNAYSHDPRTQFMNWSLWAPGAWDYAADTRGYNWGIAAELHLRAMVVNFAAVMVPTTANGPVMDSHIGKAHSLNLELVKPVNLDDHTGKVHVIAYLNQADMGDYSTAIASGIAKGVVPDIVTTRAYRSKYGFAICVEQSLNSYAGLFSRISWNDGHTETWAYTEIDRSFQIGLSIHGIVWDRDEDDAGIAAVANALSPEHRDYLTAGGYGFIIGDGKLNYGMEQIGEAFYRSRLTSTFWLTLDDQVILNPGYNKDRGPFVNVIGLRGHVEF